MNLLKTENQALCKKAKLFQRLARKGNLKNKIVTVENILLKLF